MASAHDETMGIPALEIDWTEEGDALVARCAGVTARIEREGHTGDCDPRDYDNNGIMVCWHNNYELGDCLKDDLWKFETPTAFQEWWDDVQEPKWRLPLILYDHSGISMSTTDAYPYNCPWDAGQVGWIYTTKSLLLRMGWTEETMLDKKVSGSGAHVIYTLLRREVETYDLYLRGEVYCFTIGIDGEDGEILDGCAGFLGLEHVKEDAAAQMEYWVAQQEPLFDPALQATCAVCEDDCVGPCPGGEPDQEALDAHREDVESGYGLSDFEERMEERRQMGLVD